MFFDLHRHDEASGFDGFGKPEDLAKIAKELGYQALGISNHGTTNTLIRHYFACKEQGIKPVLGVEGYFLPKFNPEKKRRGNHLCLFAKNVEGYQNICRILSEAEDTKYYNGIITMDNLNNLFLCNALFYDIGRVKNLWMISVSPVRALKTRFDSMPPPIQ